MTSPSRSVVPMPVPEDAAAPADEVPAGSAAPADEVTVLVCSSCRREARSARRATAGERLAAHARAAAEGSGVRVRQVACLGNCRRGLTAAIFRTGCWAYVFGGLGVGWGPTSSRSATVRRSEDGFMPFRRDPRR